MNQEPKVLVVDDDPQVCRMLSNYLGNAGFDVDFVTSGDQYTSRIDRRAIDIVLLDLHMPGVSGLDIARDLRACNERVGIIIVTGSEDPVDRIMGLEIGADDFVAKPFDQRELLARVRTLLRRVKSETAVAGPASGRVAFQGFELDLDTYELYDEDGNFIELTHYEYSLLAMLVRSPNRVLSRDQIMNAVAGRDWVASDRSVDVLVAKLRKKIEPGCRPSFLKTVRGVGYKFVARVEQVA